MQEDRAGKKKRFGMKGLFLLGGFLLVCVAAVFIFAPAEKKAPAAADPAQDAPRPAQDAPLSGLTALALSLDGKYLAGASSSGMLRVWDVHAGKQLHAWKAGEGAVRAAAFSKDSKGLAVSIGGKITVWERRTRKELFTIETPAAPVALEYGPEGDTLAGISESGEVLFWDAGDGRPLEGGASGFSGPAALGGGRVLRAEKDALVLSDAKSGSRLARYAFAGAFALALQPGGERAAAAGGGAIGVWDGAGAALSAIKTSENINCLALSADGSRLFHGGENGIIVMRDIATGQEIARCAGFGETAEDAEWICLSASGYYASSKKGASLFTVQAGGETFTMDQFREALHRSDLVAKALRGEKEDAKAEGGAETPAAKDGVTLAGLLKEADKIPLIQLIGDAKRTSDKAAETVRVRITDRGQGAGKIMVYNGGLCAGLPGLEEVMTSKREEKGFTVYEAALAVDLKPGLNRISMSVFGGREHGAPESKKAAVEITTSWKPPAAVETRPALHVFTAAIQTYAKAGEDLNKLKYTKADAEALRRALAGQGTTGTRYAKVETYGLYDADVTKEGLARKFGEIKPLVAEGDTFVFFFSGHGDVDGYKDFYFLPADAEGWTTNPERNILKHDLLGNLLKIPARNIFVMLDTCRSGALEDRTSAIDRAWGDLGQKANLAILMAAAGNQYAIESAGDGQGVLTWTALRGLEGGADKREGRYLGAGELLAYVKREAPKKAQQVVAKVLREAMQGGLPEGGQPMGEVATRGYTDTASLAQEPATKEPEKNFDLFDLKWRPAKITVSALTAGELRVQGEGSDQTLKLQAKKPVTLTLREGEYGFTMRYLAGLEPETRQELVENESAKTIAFTSRVIEPGTLRVRSRTAGNLEIEGLPAESAAIGAGATLTKRLPEGAYSVSVTYADKHRETKTVRVQNEKTASLAFDYRPAPVAVPKPAPSAYDYKANAQRLYKRPHGDTISGEAHYEKTSLAGRNFFLIYGAHHEPQHVLNIARVFEEEEPGKQPDGWLFLAEGITEAMASHSSYAALEYIAQSAKAWRIPAENIIPYYNDPSCFRELAKQVGPEKAAFFLVMFAMQSGEIQFIRGKGYDKDQIQAHIKRYMELCRDQKLSFDIAKFNALFPINDAAYERTAKECWDIHLKIRGKFAKENMAKTLARYPNAKNVLAYFGGAHKPVFTATEPPPPAPRASTIQPQASTLLPQSAGGNTK
jgi:hypothetical protein